MDDLLWSGVQGFLVTCKIKEHKKNKTKTENIECIYF